MRVKAEAPRTGSRGGGGCGTRGAEGEKQDLRLHLRVVGAGGPRWLVFRLWRVGRDCGGTSALGEDRVAEYGRAFLMSCQGPPGCTCVCTQAWLGVLCSHAILPATCLGHFLPGWQPGSRVLLGAKISSQSWAAEGSEGLGRFPALAARGRSRSAETRRGQGWRRGTPESRLVAQRLQHGPAPCTSRSPGFGQMRGLEAKEEMKRQRHSPIRGPVWVEGGRPNRHSVQNVYQAPPLCQH